MSRIKPKPTPPLEAAEIQPANSRNKGEGAQSALVLLAAQRKAKELAKLSPDAVDDEHPGDDWVR